MQTLVAIVHRRTARSLTARGLTARRGVLVGVAMAFAACSAPPAAAPTRPTPLPAPRPPAEIVPAVARFAVAALVTDTRYDITSASSVQRDSAGRSETQALTSRATAVLRIRRQPTGALDASGTVGAYSLTTQFSTTPLALDTLRFTAQLDSVALRVVAQPTLVNECDRPEISALGLVRAVLLRIPTTLAVGDTWRDSTVQVQCRANVPLTIRAAHSYRVLDSLRVGSGVGSGLSLRIERRAVTRVSGSNTSPWRASEITGTGDALLTALVDLRTGVVDQVDERTTLSLRLVDRASSALVRSQQLTQHVHTTARVLPP